ncbi:unnamed protein product [Darwinula stevensoni]|uniref:Uncharacterized protein n=1 Tax=Darwinula stevensoni TaxID=69355 RepID=A0A7R8X437_9CRUS|nr:unnamed protein product [Darwinula stevensoni]CAG0885605.1 unnamed protein product [Darwinula stevensoni]
MKFSCGHKVEEGEAWRLNQVPTGHNWSILVTASSVARNSSKRGRESVEMSYPTRTRVLNGGGLLSSGNGCSRTQAGMRMIHEREIQAQREAWWKGVNDYFQKNQCAAAHYEALSSPRPLPPPLEKREERERKRGCVESRRERLRALFEEEEKTEEAEVFDEDASHRLHMELQAKDLAQSISLSL